MSIISRETDTGLDPGSFRRHRPAAGASARPVVTSPSAGNAEELPLIERFSRLLFPQAPAPCLPIQPNDGLDLNASTCTVDEAAQDMGDQSQPLTTKATQAEKIESPCIAEDTMAVRSTASPMERNGHDLKEAPGDETRLAINKSGQAEDEDSREWANDIASNIRRLCLRATPTMRNWTITLPLNPEALPESSLRIEVWPHSMSLRFSTTSPFSADRVARHRCALESMLSSALSMRYDVDVDLI